MISNDLNKYNFKHEKCKYLSNFYFTPFLVEFSIKFSWVDLLIVKIISTKFYEKIKKKQTFIPKGEVRLLTKAKPFLNLSIAISYMYKVSL